MTTLDKIQELQAISGTNAKLDRLTELLSDDTLYRVFVATYNSELNFGIKKIPQYTSAETPSLYLDQAISILTSAYAKNTITGNARVNDLADILSNLSTDDAKVVEMIIARKLDCGISVTNANKAIISAGKAPIPTFNVMLCDKFDSKQLKSAKFDGDVICQTKSDGLRIIISVDSSGTVKYRTRNGKEIKLSEKYNNFFGKCPNLVFDGEAMIQDPNNALRYLDRKTGNGILNSIQQGKASEAEMDLVRFVLWDCIPYDDFMSGYSPISYSERISTFGQIENNKLIYSFVTTMIPKCEADIHKFYSENRAAGEEGIIVKLDMPYEAKRVKHQLKLKNISSADLSIVGFQEGTGKHVGMLGALVCRSGCGKLEVNVGTGFSDSQRQSFWMNRKNILGKVVEVNYNEVIKSKSKELHSLFLPVFVEVRYDKSKANTLDELV